MSKTFTHLFAAAVLSATALAPAQAQQLYSNGGFTTGTTSKSGVAAPAGYTWSEVQNDNGVTTISNTSSGFSSLKASNLELADDFTVPAGRRWTISSVDLYGYQTGATGTSSPFTEVYIRIWNGVPGATGSTIVYGDLTTNRLGSSADAMSYRIFNSLYPTASAPGTTRRIWKVTAVLASPPTLNPGTYWVDWQTSITGGAAHFMVPVTVTGSRATPNANGRQFTIPTGSTTGAWGPLVDGGNPDTAPDVNIDMAFDLNGTSVASARNGNAVLTALQVGPVPANSSVRMSYESLRRPAEVDLLDMQGRRVWHGSAAQGSSTLIVPLDKLAAGYYMVNMHSEDGSAHARVVKQ
jgi:hypothetical protein